MGLRQSMFDVLDKVLEGSYICNDMKGKVTIGTQEEARDHFNGCFEDMNECVSCLMYFIKDPVRIKELKLTKRMIIGHMNVIISQFLTQKKFALALWQELKLIQKPLGTLKTSIN